MWVLYPIDIKLTYVEVFCFFFVFWGFFVLFLALHQNPQAAWYVFYICHKALHPESGLPDIVPGAFLSFYK